MPPAAVLDASALLAVINDEPGAAVVEPLLDRAVVSTVNLSEAAAKLVDRGMPPAEARDALDGLGLTVAVFATEEAHLAAALRRSVPGSLSLGDRACLATARRRQLPAYTTDRAWAGRSGGVEVVLIR
ncbi:MAG TPA: type II toxin-antitoxin system VapC family toxin [Candidatus Dormibacteraeota bacterium]|nr:type II toxin-antitoxin system VapC family toxin [Candidatus Dormibacteraeota bacterium]